MKLLYEKKTEIKITYPKGLDFPLHVHEAVEIVLVLEGGFTGIVGNQRHKVGPGDVFIAFPNQVHGYEESRDFKGYVLIAPSKPFLSAYRATLEHNLPVSPVLHPSQTLFAQLHTMMQLAFEDRNAGFDAILRGYTLSTVGKLLLALTLTEKPTGTDALQAVLSYVSEHYTEPLRRTDIAKAVGYNESYISHLFADSLNTTLTNYITTLRLNEARHLLKETDLPVSRIAMMLGFASIRCFNRVFAREVGTTPTAYRHQYR